MTEQKKDNDYGSIVISWMVPEYEKHKRSRKWYISAGIIGLILMIFSIITLNYLFAFIIIIAALIIILHDARDPELVDFSITTEGLIVGHKFYDYDEIKNFSIVYKPRLEVKNIYFEFKNFLRHRLTIPLEDKNPVEIRKILLKYLPEDTERTDPPLSEGLAKLLKL